MDATAGEEAGDVEKLVSEIKRWTREASTREAAMERTRQRWLTERAAEDATYVGLLVDCVERSMKLTVGCSSGRFHSGRLAAVARDFVVIVGERVARSTIVPVAAITSLRPAPGEPAPQPTGSRDRTVGGTFADVLHGIAADRRRVVLGLSNGAEQLRGELCSASPSVVTIRTDGVPPSTTYVQLDSVSELSVLGSG